MNYPALKISMLAQALSVAIHAAVIAGGGLLFMRQAQFGMSTGQGGAVGLASRRVLQAEVQIGPQPEKPMPVTGRASAPNPPDELSPVPDPDAEVALTAAPPPVGTGFNSSDLPGSAATRTVPLAGPPSVGSPGTLTAKMFASGDGGAKSSARPVYLDNPPPTYPMSARQKEQEGRVLLRVTIGDGGAVKDVKIKKTSGFAVLDDAALNAVKKWTFAPATIGGVKVEDTIDLPIVFSLKK
jgi:protein TonB